MIVMFLHESAVARRLCSELHCSRRCPVTSNIYKIPAGSPRNSAPVILRIPRIESHRTGHAVGLSWKTRSSQLVLAAVRPLLARSARPMPEGSLHLRFSPSRVSGKKRFWSARLTANGCILQQLKGQPVISGQKEEKQCLAMGVGS